MPYHDSPGWERQWETYPWDWDFHVSTVSDGHRVVGQSDKDSAKNKGAKLTFGEVLDCAVTFMVENLGGRHKTTFHDLGMGPGKMLIQTYLQYFNFRFCMGVELAKGRYDLAEKNVRTLLKVGWRGRKFIGIEIKKNEFFSIVEDVPNKTPVNDWQIGDRCIGYSLFLRKDRMQRKNYTGTIIDIKETVVNDSKKNTFHVKYDDGTECQRVKHQHLFIPGTERVLEVWYGSLFDYPDGFGADMCILETDFPDHMHPNLIKCMCSTPIGCTFLTYHDLKKFKCFDWHQLRQIDQNIYDNDRYITSWSQGWRFSIWQHINNGLKFIPITDSSTLKLGESIIFQSKNTNDDGVYGEILDIIINDNDQKSDENGLDMKLVLKTNGIQNETVKIEEQSINNSQFNLFHSQHIFKIGEHVSCYKSENVSNVNNRFEIYTAKVIGVHSHSLNYIIEYSDKEIRTVPQMFVFKACKLLFKVGEDVMACWPRNAQNKNCLHRYKKFPAVVISINNNGTYKLQFDINRYLQSLLRPHLYPDDYDQKSEEYKKRESAYCPNTNAYSAENVREMWITHASPFVLNEYSKVREMIGEPYISSQLKYDMVYAWSQKDIILWLDNIGLGCTKLKTFIETSKVRLNGDRLLNMRAENVNDFLMEFCKLLQLNSSEVIECEPVVSVKDIELRRDILEQKERSEELANNEMMDVLKTVGDENEDDNKTKDEESIIVAQLQMLCSQIDHKLNACPGRVVFENNALGLNIIQMRSLFTNVSYLQFVHNRMLKQVASGGNDRGILQRLQEQIISADARVADEDQERK